VSPWTPGERVYAILGREGDVVEVFGMGTYVGEEVPPADGPDSPVGWIAEAVIEYQHENPKIQLDAGGVVWGCECWWGGEEKAKRSIGDMKVVLVNIADVRAEYRKKVAEAEAAEKAERSVE